MKAPRIVAPDYIETVLYQTNIVKKYEICIILSESCFVPSGLRSHFYADVLKNGWLPPFCLIIFPTILKFCLCIQSTSMKLYENVPIFTSTFTVRLKPYLPSSLLVLPGLSLSAECVTCVYLRAQSRRQTLTVRHPTIVGRGLWIWLLRLDLKS